MEGWGKARFSSEYRILTSASSQLSKRSTHCDRALLTFISTKHVMISCCG